MNTINQFLQDVVVVAFRTLLSNVLEIDDPETSFTIRPQPEIDSFDDSSYGSFDLGISTRKLEQNNDDNSTVSLRRGSYMYSSEDETIKFNQPFLVTLQLWMKTEDTD